MGAKGTEMEKTQPALQEMSVVGDAGRDRQTPRQAVPKR